MPLKPFNELAQIDVSKYCDIRKEKGVELKYLNWAKCVKLLHDHGAEKVYFQPIRNKENGSSLIMANKSWETGNDKITNSCYEVGVHIVIDDLEFDMTGPLMNGSNPVRDNSLTQQRVWNCQTRLFVKGVAIRTGLGFNLWCDNEDSEAMLDDDISKHNIHKIKERVQQLYTTVHKKKTIQEIADALGMTKDQVTAIFGYYDTLADFEKRLGAL